MKRFLLTLAATALLLGAIAQQSPVEYLNGINVEYNEIANNSWEYTKAVANDKNAKKIEGKRTALLKTISNAKKNVSKKGAFKGDTGYRDAVTEYLTINYDVINEDYAKIVDLEEIAEQSYDLMEAFLTAKEEAGKKLAEAGNKQQDGQKAFAEKYNIKMEDGTESDMSKKLSNASDVYDYYNKVYLIFFKPFKQEIYFIDALNASNVNGMEQNNGVLGSDAKESLKKLNAISIYKGDKSVHEACKDMLHFYADEADKKAPILIEFFLKKEQFESVKASFDNISEKKRTQADIDRFNKALGEYNGMIETYNNTNDELNKNRSKLLNNWNTSIQKFTQYHVNHWK